MRSEISKKIMAETPPEVKIFVRQYTDIVLRIHRIMEEKGYSQKDIADKMNKRPSEINKWLKGNHNLTLKTLAKLQAELEAPLICTSEECFTKKGKKKSA